METAVISGVQGLNSEPTFLSQIINYKYKQIYINNKTIQNECFNYLGFSMANEEKDIQVKISKLLKVTGLIKHQSSIKTLQ
jgi:hypothetical protein